MKVELTHDSISQLIPWYANNTLSREERAALEEHLKSCAACQSELDWLREVSGTVTELVEEAPDVNRALAKTMAAVEDWERSKRPATRSRLASWFASIWNPSVPVARWVFAAQFVLIVALGIFSMVPRRSTPGFGTASGPEQAAHRARLTVNFAPDTTVQQMMRTLSSVGGKIVEGPSASGIYFVELPIPAEKEAEVQSLIEKLRADNTILFVERQP